MTSSPSTPDSVFYYSCILFIALLQDFLYLGPPLLPYSSVSRKINYLVGGQQPLVVDHEELVVVVQLLSSVRLLRTPWTAAPHAFLSFAILLNSCPLSC